MKYEQNDFQSIILFGDSKIEYNLIVKIFYLKIIIVLDH